MIEEIKEKSKQDVLAIPFQKCAICHLCSTIVSRIGKNFGIKHISEDDYIAGDMIVIDK